MDLTFGTRLRLQREKHQVRLSDIAEQTKIKLSLLQALERDDVSHWPSGIFRRGYLRSYAKAVDLDPDAVVREFLELYPDPGEEFAEVVNTRSSDSASSRPPTRLRTLLGSAIFALPSLRSSRQKHGGEEPASTADDREASHDLEPCHADDPAPPADDRAHEDAHEDALVYVEPPRSSASRISDIEYEAPIQPDADDDITSPAPPVTAPPMEVVPAAESSNDRLRVDLSAVARLCTRLARTLDPEELTPLLEDAATMLRAVGVIVWVWHQPARALRPLLSHGYGNAVLAQLPRIAPEADNAIAAAFRSVETRVVEGDKNATGALVIPLITPTGCGGVLALELRDGDEQQDCVRALATIFAAQLSTLVACPPIAQAATA